MGVIFVKLNKKEEKMIKKLTEHFHEDKSTLIKKSLLELLYENVIDFETIKTFEEKEKKGKVAFSAAEDILERD